jgi:hypothetical protein
MLPSNLNLSSTSSFFFCRCHSTIYCIKHSVYSLFIWSST